MKYTYFAPLKGGKFFIRSLFQYNQKSYSLLSAGHDTFLNITKPSINGFHICQWYWEKKFTHEIRNWFELRHLTTEEELLYQHSEHTLKFTNTNTFAQCPINLYKIFPQVYESDVVVNPLVSLGYCSGIGSREMNYNLERRMAPMNVDLEFSLKELRSRCNIVAYKENIFDWVQNFFLESYSNILEREGEDVYFNHVSNKINDVRLFEKLLINVLEYYRIPYEKFNLDSDDYCKTFGLTKSIDTSSHKDRFTSLPYKYREKVKTWTENYLLNN
tara:strand:+ start:1812 stop:2630 length:819 start_codon:yes stop_codon:yes gene_type:complete